MGPPRKIIAATPKILSPEVHTPACVRLLAADAQLVGSLARMPIPLPRTPVPAEPWALAFLAPPGHATVVESHDGPMALAGAGVFVFLLDVPNHPPGWRLRFRRFDT